MQRRRNEPHAREGTDDTFAYFSYFLVSEKYVFLLDEMKFNGTRQQDINYFLLVPFRPDPLYKFLDQSVGKRFKPFLAIHTNSMYRFVPTVFSVWLIQNSLHVQLRSTS
jgi:hypothetical protein